MKKTNITLAIAFAAAASLVACGGGGSDSQEVELQAGQGCKVATVSGLCPMDMITIITNVGPDADGAAVGDAVNNIVKNP